MLKGLQLVDLVNIAAPPLQQKNILVSMHTLYYHKLLIQKYNFTSTSQHLCNHSTQHRFPIYTGSQLSDLACVSVHACVHTGPGGKLAHFVISKGSVQDFWRANKAPGLLERKLHRHQLGDLA